MIRVRDLGVGVACARAVAVPLDDADHDDFLSVSGCRVEWFTGTGATRVVRKVYTVETPVLDAVWVRFEEPLSFRDEGHQAQRSTWTLCIAEQHCLTLFAASGAMYSVSVPFSVSSRQPVLPLASGLLLQREAISSSSGGGGGGGAASQPPSEPAVSLFSLPQPLEEVRPVQRAHGGAFEGRRAIYASQDPARMFVVLFDPATRLHAVSRLRRCPLLPPTHEPPPSTILPFPPPLQDPPTSPSPGSE